MKDIYTEEGVVKTYIEGKVITVIWDSLSNKNALYNSCKAQLEIVKKGDADVIIIDISNALGTPPMEVQQWFGEVLFPGYKSSPSFRGLINILPNSTITKMGANHWKKTAESDQFGFLVYETESIDAAKLLAEKMLLETA